MYKVNPLLTVRYGRVQLRDLLVGIAMKRVWIESFKVYTYPVKKLSILYSAEVGSDIKRLHIDQIGSGIPNFIKLNLFKS